MGGRRKAKNSEGEKGKKKKGCAVPGKPSECAVCCVLRGAGAGACMRGCDKDKEEKPSMAYPFYFHTSLPVHTTIHHGQPSWWLAGCAPYTYTREEREEGTLNRMVVVRVVVHPECKYSAALSREGEPVHYTICAWDDDEAFA